MKRTLERASKLRDQLENVVLKGKDLVAGAYALGATLATLGRLGVENDARLEQATLVSISSIIINMYRDRERAIRALEVMKRALYELDLRC